MLKLLVHGAMCRVLAQFLFYPHRLKCKRYCVMLFVRFSLVSFHDSPTMYYYSAYIQTVKWLWWLMAEHQAMQVVLYISPPLPRSNCFAFFQRGPFMCVWWRDGFHSNGHLLQIRMFCCYLELQYFQVVELHNWHTPAQLKVGKKVWSYNWGRDFPNTDTTMELVRLCAIVSIFFTAWKIFQHFIHYIT